MDYTSDLMCGPDGKNWRCDDERLEQVFQTTKRDSKLKKILPKKIK